MQMKGLFWELNPGPLAPKARIMPLDQTADGMVTVLHNGSFQIHHAYVVR